jgi:elongation factor G
MTISHPTGPRAAVLCGPYLSGKTSLMEAMLAEAGALNRRGSVTDGTSVGDSTPEARAHGMSTELSVATTEYLGERWSFIDCPGNVELSHEARGALTVADVAVVVCDPDPDKAAALAPLLRALDENGVPHMLFINKMDQAAAGVRAALEALQSASARPLVLREVPIREGDAITGHVDLISERAFHWEEGKPSSLIELPETVRDRETEARAEMLESLADHDDDLLEKLLEDVVPSTDEVYATLTKDLAENLVVPVFFGSATHSNGVRRLMKALRHDAPGVSATADRQALPDTGAPLLRVFKTQHAGHSGKLSLARVMRGALADGDRIAGARPAGISRLFGAHMERVPSAETGDIVALGKLEDVSTGAVISVEGTFEDASWPDPPPPLFAQAIRSANRSDDVKLPANLAKILDEDTSLSTDHDETTGEYVLRGQGEMHLKLALERLANRSGLTVDAAPPRVAYRETIQKTVRKHARHKKQSGGHGEFGDVHVEVAPLGRGDGFRFGDRIHGGVVPKQYIPAVEAGARDALAKGPLGFPVVDLAMTLVDGQHHSVDSSEMAFRKAGAQAMREALPEAGPVLLEPINAVTISVPNTHTPKIQRIVTGRRGQIMGFDAKSGWDGWDEVTCYLPAAEMNDLIVELRSATQGTGTFEARFDRLQELTGREADKVIRGHAEAAE